MVTLGTCPPWSIGMREQGRIIANPLAGTVRKVSTAGLDETRRALTDDEMRRLLAVAGDRKPVYLAGVRTGLRRSELEGLRWGDVHLDAPKPFLRVRASTTKNGRVATMWLTGDLAAVLKTLTEARGAGDAVFEEVPSMEAFRADL